MNSRIPALSGGLILLLMQGCATQHLKLEMRREITLIPPGINSLDVEPSGHLDTTAEPHSVKVTMMGDPELTASFDVEGRLKSRDMKEVEPGVYVGSFDVPKGETGSLWVVGHLVHQPTGAHGAKRADGSLDLVRSEEWAGGDRPADGECSTENLREFEDRLRGLTVHFEFNHFEVPPGERDRLLAGRATLTSHPACMIHVHGHADEVGTPQYNETLSWKRALEIQRLLESELGIPRDRLAMHGHGETQPVDTSLTPEGMALNRRVEFHVLVTE